MTFELQPMGQADADAVAGWHYESPYSFYDWSADGDDHALLLAPESRDGRFYSVRTGDGELAGFFEFQVEGEDVVVGLGLRPELTGRGLGEDFIEAGLAFARKRLGPSRFRLSVAAFNRRAIRVYERAGFEVLRTYDHETNGGVFRFVELARPG